MGRRVGNGTVLVALLVLAVVAALLTPEVIQSSGGASSRSTAPGGAQIAYELSKRMGWRTARRDAPLDSSPASPPSVQVVIAPQQALGAREVHWLLENVRRGGGLVFTVDGAGEIADSIGLMLRERELLLYGGRGEGCPTPSPLARRAMVLPPAIHEIGWRRPPPGSVTPIGTGLVQRDPALSVATGIALGRGRVAAVSSGEIFANDAVRACEWGADIAVARVLEFMRPDSGSPLPLVFDEFHHGYGVHGGSVAAIWAYLSRTGSGRFLATLLAAALLLLFAATPRPIVPSEPLLIPRRSPLEHADALGRAYADVDATRTATARLLDGVRRRAGRIVPVRAAADDATFLDAVVVRAPALAPQVAIVRRGLAEPQPPRALGPIGEALAEIERTLLATPSHTT